MIYFTSDLHFCHDRAFMFEPRGFTNIDDHDKTIIENWNKTITDEDEVYLLGDLMLNDNEKGMSYMRQLKGKIHIILGNHDTPMRASLYATLPNVLEVVHAAQIKYKGKMFYLSHYPTVTSAGEAQKGPEKVLYSLFGHTHQQTNFYNDSYFIYHVGLDSHNNYPVSIEQVIEECYNNFNNK